MDPATTVHHSVDWSIVGIAAFGSLAINLLNLMEALQLPPDRRPTFTDVAYWVPYVIYPILGGFVAYVYLTAQFDLNAVLALQVGASAPLILRAAAAAIPRGLGPQDVPAPNVPAPNPPNPQGP